MHVFVGEVFPNIRSCISYHLFRKQLPCAAMEPRHTAGWRLGLPRMAEQKPAWEFDQIVQRTVAETERILLFIFGLRSMGTVSQRTDERCPLCETSHRKQIIKE